MHYLRRVTAGWMLLALATAATAAASNAIQPTSTAAGTAKPQPPAGKGACPVTATQLYKELQADPYWSIDSPGMTPLQQAAYAFDAARVACLVKATTTAAINAAGKSGYNALGAVVMHMTTIHAQPGSNLPYEVTPNALETLKLLLKAGADPNNAMQRGSKEGALLSLLNLLTWCVPGCKGGCCPQRNAISAVKLVLDAGENVHNLDAFGRTPLAWVTDACATNDADAAQVAQLILAKGANVNAPASPSDVAPGKSILQTLQAMKCPKTLAVVKQAAAKKPAPPQGRRLLDSVPRS